MKDYNEYSKAAYNEKADNYNDTFDGKFTQPFKELLCTHVKVSEGSIVLDVACGNGTLLKMLSKKTEIKGYGIDISDRMIENAVKNCPDMTFAVAGCENIPFKSDFFDAMTVSAAYHHFPDVKKFAEEASRVIKKGGSLYIAEIYLSPILRVLINPFIRFSKEGDVKFYSSGEIIRNFEPFGFKEEWTIREGKIQLICLRK